MKYSAQISKGLMGAFNSKPLQVTVIGIVVAYFVYKTINKIILRKQIFNPDMPDGGSGIPTNGKDSSGRPIPWDEGPIVANLYRALKGMAWSTDATDKALTPLFALTNDQLTRVYASFNRMYYSEGDGTLTEWLEDEVSILAWPTRDKIVTRLKSLGLK